MTTALHRSAASDTCVADQVVRSPGGVHRPTERSMSPSAPAPIFAGDAGTRADVAQADTRGLQSSTLRTSEPASRGYARDVLASAPATHGPSAFRSVARGVAAAVLLTGMSLLLQGCDARAGLDIIGAVAGSFAGGSKQDKH